MAREDMAEEIGEFLERLGRRLKRMDRHERRWHNGEERWGGPPWERWGEHFERFFGGRGEWDEADADVDVEERELTFGEQPELRLTVHLLSARLYQVEPGGKARIVVRGRQDLRHVEIESSGDGTGAVDVRIERRFGGFGGMARRPVDIYVPAGTRIRARADAGSLVAEGLEQAELDLRTDAGRLRVESCNGRMRLASSAGKLVVERCSGSLEAKVDAGKLQVEEFSGTIVARTDAGSLQLRSLRLQPGEHALESSMGSIDASIVPDPNVPLRVVARASLGSVNNRIGEGPSDAPAVLHARADLGSIRIRWEERPATPLRAVPVLDERESNGYASPSKPVEMRQVPLEEEQPPAGRPEAAAEPAAGAEQSGSDTAEAQSSSPQPSYEDEVTRILGMVERHEVSAGEGASLLAALRR
jgi:hypothetical protein